MSFRMLSLSAAVLTSVLVLSSAVCRADGVPSWQTGIPRINGPRVIGAVPNRAFSHALPITGAREGLRVSVSGSLPEGVVFDAARAEFSGKAAKGESRLKVTAANAAGETRVEIVLKIGDETWEIRHALERAAAVRDVVRHQDLGTAESLTYSIPPHACRVCTFLFSSTD